MSRGRTRAILAGLLTIAWSAGGSASAAPFTYTPDIERNAVSVDGLIPVKRFMNIPLPAGSVEFADGGLAVNIIPNWNFDRVAVLQGPIIHTEVTTNGRQALISGVVLFNRGWWYDRYWTPSSSETVVTNSGATTVGKITDLTPDSLVVTTGDGTTVSIPLSDIKELHSPRAYAFAVPAVAPAAVTPDQSWNADVQTVTLSPTTGPATIPSTATIRRDPLLVTRDPGEWSNAKIAVIGTVLSLAELAQFVPEVVLPQYSHQLWQHNNKKSFYNLTNGVPPVPAPLINGNTYSLPVPGNRTN